MKTSFCLALTFVFSTHVSLADTAADVEVLPQQKFMKLLESYKFKLEPGDRKLLVDFVQQVPEPNPELAKLQKALGDADKALDARHFFAILDLEGSQSVCSKLTDHSDPLLRFVVNLYLTKAGDDNAATAIHKLIHSEKPTLPQKRLIKTFCLAYGIRAESDSSKQISELLVALADKAPKLKPGDIAPSFKATDISGKSLDSEQLKGRIVLLHFWASFCGPCMAQMDDVIDEVKGFPPDKVVIIFVSLDFDRQAFDKALKKHEFPGRNVLSEAGVGGDIPRAYGVNFIPYDVIIDIQGIVRSKSIKDIPELLSGEAAPKTAKPGKESALTR